MSKKVTDKTVLSLADDIRLISRITGKKILPHNDPNDFLSEYVHWEYSTDELRVFYVERRGFYAMEYSNKLVFFCRYLNGKYEYDALIDIQELKRRIEGLARQARKTLKLSVYRSFARDIAQYLGKAVFSENFCGVDYYKNVYEDEKIIIEAEQTIEWDTKIYLKIGKGLRLVLDPNGYLEGEWMKYVSMLKNEAWRVCRNSRRGYIDDSSLFS